ncbi:unnamed protein product [Gemmata massiliana]|uniref:Uncharacterized protein n=1 Tax=Gemmata massiliana TaxID=1210884 RepID=A0A6P2DGP7_9BACT|nr:hypothetical protein [Gemmata massiliana]VTS00764.1 unnamed protein product [Gemmata massiliana]
MDATLDDVLDELKKQVKLATIANTIASGTQLLMTKALPAGLMAGPGTQTAAPKPPAGMPLHPPGVPGTGHPQQHNSQQQQNQQGGQAQQNSNTKKNRRGKKSSQSFWSRVRGGIANKVKSGRLGRAYSGGQKGVGSFLGGKGPTGMKGLGGMSGAAARVAGPVAVVAGVVQGLNEFRKAVVQATDEQLAAARKLRDVSGHMDLIFAQSDIKDAMRGMRQGQAQAQSTARLADSEQRRKDSMEPLENAVTNIKNDLLAKLNDAILPAIEVCADIAKFIERNWPWSVKEEEKKKEPLGLAGSMQAAEAEAARITAEGRRLMDRARAASGTSRPGGRLP